MPRMQQNTYLSHAKNPELFGYEALRVNEGYRLKGAAKPHSNQTTELKLGKNNLPVIPIRSHNRLKRMNALLDTASPVSWMEFGASQKFDAEFLGDETYKVPYTGNLNTGNAAAYAAAISQLRLGSITLDNALFYVRMALHSLGPMARGIQVPHVDSVLGYDTLKTFEFIQFDFLRNQVRFSSGPPYVPDEQLLMSAAKIMELKNYGLVIQGGLLGIPTPIILDVAGEYHFSRGDVKMNITKQVSLGDVVYRKVPTLLLPTYDGPPRAGRRMLENYTVTICPKTGIVYFERFPE
ncbi:hypothetical protein P4E94_17800 [Pontiellaceae bacterium B12219]|nr:hypothetical protein [Pontiellaceae bacterium B12219]